MNVRANIEWVKQVEGEFEYSDTWAKFTEIAGLVISEVNHDSYNEQINICFTDGTHLAIRDDGQSCCETRWITCDDDLTGLVGGSVVAIDTEASGTTSDDRGDQQFVKVQTTRGGFTLCTHNEHNGYYGGFSITIERVR